MAIPINYDACPGAMWKKLIADLLSVAERVLHHDKQQNDNNLYDY